MSTTILDSNFPTPETLNALDCVSSDRHLDKVNELVSIVNVCQDPYNPALVIMSFTLVGAFLFTPICQILSVDGDTSYTQQGTIVPIAIGHYRNSEMPINTHCQTSHPEIVFDFGRVIPNFLSCSSITFLITMVGTIPQSFGVSFPPQSPTTTYTWTKGVLPRPISLNYNNNSLVVAFQYDGAVDCSCNIQCIEPSGVSRNIKFCPDEVQMISVSASLTGDPYNFSLGLRDSIGNTSSVNIQTVYNVIPNPPIGVVSSGPQRVELFIDSQSLNGQPLTDIQYQILKYAGTPYNYIVWKDWSERPLSYFIDRDVIPNQIYGYAVRYKGKFNDVSNTSSWTIVGT